MPAVPSWSVTTLPIVGGGAFPVRRVICVGRNYVEHAKEMGHSGREAPFFFGKVAEAVTDAETIAYPPATSDLHHEVELVVALGGGGRDIPLEKATGLIWGYAVGVDLTRRDLQAEAKKLGRPWHVAKSWVGAAPTGPIYSAETIGHPRQGEISLEVNGKTRQSGDLSQMIWSVEEIVSHLSGLDELLPGDLIFTGTPAGVSALIAGDQVTATIAGLASHSFTMKS